MKLENYNSDIVIHFPAYAGGKFIANCLFLSKHCLVNYPDSQTIVENPENYDRRLSMTLSSLPPKNQMQQWIRYEFDEFNQNKDLYYQAKDKQLRCVGCMHELDNNLNSYWENFTIVKLINYHKFRICAYSLKKSTRKLTTSESLARYRSLKGEDWPSYTEFQQVGFNTKFLPEQYNHVKQEMTKFYTLGTTDNEFLLFDISSLYNWNAFSKAVSNLYNQLGLDDYNEKIVHKYYKNYTRLHNI